MPGAGSRRLSESMKIGKTTPSWRYQVPLASVMSCGLPSLPDTLQASPCIASTYSTPPLGHTILTGQQAKTLPRLGKGLFLRA